MKPNAKLPACLSVRDFALELGLSEKTVRRWIDAGELRHHRLGRSIRITLEDAKAFIAVRRR